MDFLNDPAMLELYLEQMGYGTQEKDLMRQQKLAQGLRQSGAMPEMRQAGRVAVSASPLEALNAGISGALGGYQEGRLSGQLGELAKQRSGALATRARAGWKGKPEAPAWRGAGDMDIPTMSTSPGWLGFDR